MLCNSSLKSFKESNRCSQVIHLHSIRLLFFFYFKCLHKCLHCKKKYSKLLTKIIWKILFSYSISNAISSQVFVKSTSNFKVKTSGKKEILHQSFFLTNKHRYLTSDSMITSGCTAGLWTLVCLQIKHLQELTGQRFYCTG